MDKELRRRLDRATDRAAWAAAAAAAAATLSCGWHLQTTNLCDISIAVSLSLADIARL